MKLNVKGLLIVLSGPSGVGKGTVRKALFNKKGHNLVYSISMTTRKPRKGEVDGEDYYFVSKAEFEKRIANDQFLEWTEFVGNYYGTPREKIETQLQEGHEVVLEIEVNGALQVRDKMPEAVFIFLVPPGKQALFDRLKLRGTENYAIIEERIAKAKEEFLLAYKYDYIVVNDDYDNAADRILAIIRAEHAKTERSIHQYIKMLGE
ncbi:MAG: guanylate kinase [Acholeplasmatales bacterium]|nr:guanylate kinase [Acholeplasmataceae bacterium]MDY0114934.1 guanylate kinase [Acholeplasmatales bacterium]MCK9234228.1 guanylate kinase [Acholeplasmataceae bacterium]MCK9289501.1 guanylate kinase [Acholeplasmataceae bacterium]MCK9427126.1 guanylate kinase [Acholeplasmataceae bacterium]